MTPSELLSAKECLKTFEQVLAAAHACGVNDVELTLQVTNSALTRFANNTIHQNVAERQYTASIRTILDHRTARATTNRIDVDSLRRTVEEAAALTKAQHPDPDVLPLADPPPCPELNRYSPVTAQSTPEERAQVVREAIRVAEESSQIAAGIYAANQSAEALLNSRGLAAYHHETLGQFSITAMAGDSSGWAKASAPECAGPEALLLARRAVEKATLSRNPRELAPGRYTVILEPAAVTDLVGQMFSDFSATAIRDQRSFLTGRIGEQIFGDNISIYDDAYHPLQSGAAFDSEGIVRRRLTLVDKGVVREVPYSRQEAHRAGVAPTGHGFPLPNEYGESPTNIVIAGGTHRLEELISCTERGVLVTRLWYIREVDPYEKIMTGMTRDGTFLVEDGRIAGGLRNFRFNQSLIDLLKSVEAMSPAVRASGEEAFDMVAPAMKVRDFHFTEVTRF